MNFKKVVKIIVGCSFVLGLVMASSVSSYGDVHGSCYGDGCMNGNGHKANSFGGNWAGDCYGSNCIH